MDETDNKGNRARVANMVGGVLNGFKEGGQAGEEITANTLSFGATDAMGLTSSGQYQGGAYDASRALSTVGRELLITAGTLGMAQAYRAGGYAGYGLLAAGGEGYAMYQNAGSVMAGIDNLQQGNAIGFVQIGAGA